MKKYILKPKKLISLALAFFLIATGTFCLAQSSSTAASGSESQDATVVDETVPLLLEGIWENSSRYVIFDSSYVTKTDRKRIPTIALKTFYQWYNDRAAESDEYTLANPRERNNVHAKTPQQIEIHFEPLTFQVFTKETGQKVKTEDGALLYADEVPSGAWDMQVKYPYIKDIYHIPVAVIGNKVYLKFKIKQDLGLLDEDPKNGYWEDFGWASGILVCPPYSNKELLCYYVVGKEVYHIRYWRTDMEYDGETMATFSDGAKSYTVPKHIYTGGKVFTCVNGRSRKIRNIDKSSKIPEETTYNSVIVERKVRDIHGNLQTTQTKISTVCAIGEPYLELVEGSRTFEEILAEAALRKRPDPQPLFPVRGLAIDFDFSIVQRPPESWDRAMMDMGK